MGGKNENKPDPEAEPGGMQEEQVSNTQEALPVVWTAGRRKIAGRWLGLATNQFAWPAPVEPPGGKK